VKRRKMKLTLRPETLSSETEAFSPDMLLPVVDRRRVGDPVEAVADMVSNGLRVSAWMELTIVQMNWPFEGGVICCRKIP